MKRKIPALALLAASMSFGTRAEAGSVTSVEFVPSDPADSVNVGYDAFAVVNTSTTKAVLVQSPMGMKAVSAGMKVGVNIYIDNTLDHRTTTCSMFGYSTTTNTEHAGTASTSATGKQLLYVELTVGPGPSSDITFFTLQCSLPKGGTHKIFGAVTPIDVVR